MSNSKADLIAKVQANLELPDAPPVASDWDSSSTSINSSSTSRQDDTTLSTGGGATGLREPAPMDSGVRSSDGADLSNVGRQGKDGLDGLPDDAVTSDKKGAKGTVDTTGEDYGTPKQK